MIKIKNDTWGVVFTRYKLYGELSRVLNFDDDMSMAINDLSVQSTDGLGEKFTI